MLGSHTVEAQRIGDDSYSLVLKGCGEALTLSREELCRALKAVYVRGADEEFIDGALEAADRSPGGFRAAPPEAMTTRAATLLANYRAQGVAASSRPVGSR
jgi:hypothetical protein